MTVTGRVFAILVSEGDSKHLDEQSEIVMESHEYYEENKAGLARRRVRGEGKEGRLYTRWPL